MLELNGETVFTQSEINKDVDHAGLLVHLKLSVIDSVSKVVNKLTRFFLLNTKSHATKVNLPVKEVILTLPGTLSTTLV